ncbi:M3 family oligoendopeptidase [Fervidobacterium nodosum]|uniref:Peptidase M3A and M3B thimet/oligopeptidase F n=1 Tax=Fervidobacterium nodosum (strain ATCC 35602 / DSM 5306 / Rt17-B1) TaxID=381764 RepID=A7HLF3_FERNB|nr:M3 family oligoendopeptidase [Fervidobacterium nodosum]ABS60736.1 peptidase M3A and M3B thimet/oligopeptidase F [Fervidobacterium nodosum Rt17-B1]PHJ14194.1 peptidase M3 [Fervidobacterium sp. SC_NGM5_G05]
MQWDFKTVFQSDEEAIENAKRYSKLIGSLVDELEKEKELNKIIKLIKEIEDSTDNFSKSIQYAWMRYSVNTKEKESQKLLGTIQSLESNVGEYFAKLEVRLSKLSKKDIQELKKIAPNYTHFIEVIEKRKKHLLSKEAEQVLALTSISRREAISKIHNKLESSYKFKIEIDGEIKVLTPEEVKALRRSTNSDLRKKAMKTFLKRFQEDSLVITEVYNLVVKDYDLESKIRKFARPISMRNFENEVSDDVVDSLIETTNENVNILREYYKWKSEVMNEKLTLADIYAPITTKARKFSFDEAKEIILDAYYSFSNKAGDIVKSFFENSRIDLYPREGKIGGAYCIYSTTKLPAYVLTNFNGDMYDIMTLAHELGHGLHGTLSKKQTYFNYDTPLTLAELASVFGEFLVFDYLKGKLDKEERLALISSKIEDTFATTFRQNFFTNFEIRSHDLISNSGYADWEELNDIYYEELRKTFGEVVEIPQWYKNEWAMISHFFETPFYVYSYNFAHCLVIALYQKYLEEGKSFTKKYLSLLESGGSLSPNELLSKVGIDISRSDFWEKAFDFIDSLVKEIKINYNK